MDFICVRFAEAASCSAVGFDILNTLKMWVSQTLNHSSVYMQEKFQFHPYYLSVLARLVNSNYCLQARPPSDEVKSIFSIFHGQLFFCLFFFLSIY